MSNLVMEEVKSTYDVDLALESTVGTILSADTVAIWSNDDGMYGVYVKGGGESLWWLKFTSLNIQSLMEN